MNVIQPTKRMAKTMALADFVLNAADIKAEIESALVTTNKELVKKVDEIHEMEKVAQKDLHAALVKRHQADAYVEKVSLDAERAAGDIRADALKKAESKMAPLVKRENVISADEKKLAAHGIHLEARESEVAVREAVAEKKQAEAKTVIAEYTQRSAKLQKAKALMDAAGV